jgi:hypothetical protein
MAAAAPPRRREHHRPQTRRLSQRAQLRGRARTPGSQPAQPLQWHAPKAATAVDPRVIASPEQVDAILRQVGKIRPELTAFFGCLYYPALRPAEAVALRRDCLTLPARGWGQLTLINSLPGLPVPGPGGGNGTSHELRGLKLRPEGTILWGSITGSGLGGLPRWDHR